MLALVERLDDMDVHELGRLSATLAQQVHVSIDRRALLLKLAAGLSLAAVAPAISTLEADAAQDARPSTRNDRFAGVWHSRYVYYSSGVKVSSPANTTMYLTSRKINYRDRVCRTRYIRY